MSLTPTGADVRGDVNPRGGARAGRPPGRSLSPAPRKLWVPVRNNAHLFTGALGKRRLPGDHLLVWEAGGAQHGRGRPWPGPTPVGTQAGFCSQASLWGWLPLSPTGHRKVRSLSHTGSPRPSCEPSGSGSLTYSRPSHRGLTPQRVGHLLSDRGAEHTCPQGVSCRVPGTRTPICTRISGLDRPGRGAIWHPVHPDLTAAGRGTHLERDPQGVDLGRFLCQGRRLGPDVGEPHAAGGKVPQGGGERAAVLVARHDEEVHDEGGEEQQEQHARQGEPVHLPAGRRWARWAAGPPAPRTAPPSSWGPPRHPPGHPVKAQGPASERAVGAAHPPRFLSPRTSTTAASERGPQRAWVVFSVSSLIPHFIKREAAYLLRLLTVQVSVTGHNCPPTPRPAPCH